MAQIPSRRAGCIEPLVPPVRQPLWDVVGVGLAVQLNARHAQLLALIDDRRAPQREIQDGAEAERARVALDDARVPLHIVIFDKNELSFSLRWIADRFGDDLLEMEVI